MSRLLDVRSISAAYDRVRALQDVSLHVDKGEVIALIGAVFLAIAGFLWYPIKRMLRKGRKPAEASRDNADD